MSFKAVPLTRAQIEELVTRWHRHNRGTGAIFFGFGIESDGELKGACTVGPVTARLLSDAPRTAELHRLVTDGSRNMCSWAYGKAWRIAQELGYSRVITYTLQTESGSSLRASGWRLDDANVPARRWKSRAPEYAHLRWKDRPDACVSPSFPRRRWIIGEPWPTNMARYLKGAENPSSPNWKSARKNSSESSNVTATSSPPRADNPSQPEHRIPLTAEEGGAQWNHEQNGLSIETLTSLDTPYLQSTHAESETPLKAMPPLAEQFTSASVGEAAVTSVDTECAQSDTVTRGASNPERPFDSAPAHSYPDYEDQ
jgi:hypothetical protein